VSGSATTRLELPGWRLVWWRLETTGDPGAKARLAARRARLAERLRESGQALTDDPVVAALRRLFRAAGTDPTRYRPSSEALLRRLLKGEDLPEIHPLVDLNNQLSIELRVPACVLAEGSFSFPVTLRAGREGEGLETLRGPLSLEGKPVLEDAAGPFGTPITDGQRVKVLAETRRAWLVAYLPEQLLDEAEARSALEGILEEAPVARRLDPTDG
jgi:DNA/RNA-binding domain of Phe-tRNA-synthetase-like protein